MPLDCVSASVLANRCGGDFRVYLSVRNTRQKVDDDSQREEAAFCSPSVVSSEISSMWQRETVDILTSRQQLKGAQLLVTHANIHIHFTRLWDGNVAHLYRSRRRSSGLFQLYNSESNNARQFYINKGASDSTCRLFVKAFYICGLNTQRLVLLSQ